MQIEDGERGGQAGYLGGHDIGGQYCGGHPLLDWQNWRVRVDN